jgi:hypothetical protein
MRHCDRCGEDVSEECMADHTSNLCRDCDAEVTAEVQAGFEADAGVLEAAALAADEARALAEYREGLADSSAEYGDRVDDDSGWEGR